MGSIIVTGLDPPRKRQCGGIGSENYGGSLISAPNEGAVPVSADTSSSAVILNLEEGSFVERLEKISLALGALKQDAYMTAIRSGLGKLISDYQSSARQNGERFGVNPVAVNQFSAPQNGGRFGVQPVAVNDSGSLKELVKKSNTIEELIKEQLSLEVKKINQKISKLDQKIVRSMKNQNGSNGAPRAVEPWRDKPIFSSEGNNFSTDTDLVVVVRKVDHKSLRSAKASLLRDPRIIEGQAKVNFVNLHRNGNAYFHCQDFSSKGTVESVLRQMGIVTSSIQRNVDFFRIGPMDLSVSPEEVIKAIKNQNKQLQNADIKFHSKISSRSNSKFLAFKADYLTCKQIIQLSTINVGLTRMNISTFVPLIQCHKCARFGHMANHCWYKAMNCSNCGEGHKLEECRTPNIKSCSNCRRRGWRYDHHSWETKCPVRASFMRERVLLKREKISRLESQKHFGTV